MQYQSIYELYPRVYRRNQKLDFKTLIGIKKIIWTTWLKRLIYLFSYLRASTKNQKTKTTKF